MVRRDVTTTDVDAAFVRRMTERLHATGFDAQILSALEQFAGPMLDELFGRIATLETKATSVVGWSTALLGFLLFWSNKPSAQPGLGLVYAATLMAIAAILSGSFAACARRWQWPTIEQWFREDEFNSPTRLRAQHLIALLRAYQSHTVVSKRQGWALLIGQAAVFIAGMLVGAAIFLG